MGGDSQPSKAHFETVRSPLPPSVPYNSVPLLIGEEYAVPLSCAVNPTKDLIACGTETGTVLIYRAFSLQMVRSIKVDDNAIYKLLWAPDSQSIIVATMNALIWLSLARDTSIIRLVEGNPVCTPGQAVRGGSNEFRDNVLQSSDKQTTQAGDILAVWQLEDQELSLLSYSVAAWLVEVDSRQLHSVSFGQSDFHYRSCFRVVGIEILITVAINFYEAVGLRSITFLAHTYNLGKHASTRPEIEIDAPNSTDINAGKDQSQSQSQGHWAHAYETDYTLALTAAFGTGGIPPTADVLAITGYLLVISTGLKYVLLRRDRLFSPYNIMGVKEYTAQILREEIGYTGALGDRRFEVHKQTLYTSEEPTIAVQFLSAEKGEANVGADKTPEYIECMHLQKTALGTSEANMSLYVASFRSFHHFFLFLYSYHASLHKAQISYGKTRFYETLTDSNFQSLCDRVVEITTQSNNSLMKLLNATTFKFSANVCDFSAIVSDLLIASFTLAEEDEASSAVGMYITGVFDLSEVFRALETDLTKKAADTWLLYPNPGLAELIMNYITISFTTSIDKQWLYLANSHFIMTLSVAHNVCEIYEYCEHFLINDLVFDTRLLSEMQIEFGYAPHELIMASVGYFPPYTADNMRSLMLNPTKQAIKQANVYYGKIRELASAAKKKANDTVQKRLSLSIKRTSGRRSIQRRGAKSSSSLTSASAKTGKPGRPGKARANNAAQSTNEEPSDTTTASSVNVNMNANATVNIGDAVASDGNLLLSNANIDYLQRLILHVEPQLMFWACKEIQDFNSCFPGFETTSTNVLYIEHEDELDIDPSPLYPETALPRAVDVNYHEMQYPTRNVENEEIDLLSLRDEVPPYHYMYSYRQIHELSVRLNMFIQ